MNRPTVLRNSAEPEIVIGIALKIFYKANDWVDNAEFLDKLDYEYDAIGKNREVRSGGQAIAKYKPSVYYGLLDVSPDGKKRRINEFGKKYYEAYMVEDQDAMVDCLIQSIQKREFGQNNPAVPDSRSRIEPPKVFLVSCLLLNNKLSKNEYAYIIENLAFEKDYKKILVEISLSRLLGSELKISDYAKNNYRDDKGLKFLSDAGFFNEEKGIKSIKDKYVLKYSELLSSLAIVTEDVATQPQTNPNIPQINQEGIISIISTYLTAIRTKPFLLLAGISGTGKSRIVRKLAQATNDIDFAADYNGEERWKKHTPTNFSLIQVKPNWHNSMDVVGFKSNIGGAHYEFTPFIEFIAKAWHYPDTPFFLCLDEMNLAPVEEYFAEFLSAIESRSYNKDGEYETDPIVKPFDDFGVEVCVQMTKHLCHGNVTLENQFRTKGLTLPKNLIVMGTVNMDETTFSFSRKVLDRAMSIEMNEVDYDAFLMGQTEDDVPLLTDCNMLLVERPINAQNVKNNIEADKIIAYLKQVNELLDGTPFKLGYRAANEAFLYVSASKMFGSDDLGSALDKFTVMKILSRIEGDDSKLKTKSGNDLLPALLELLTTQFGVDGKSISVQKLTEMNDILTRDHFVSFWG